MTSDQSDTLRPLHFEMADGVKLAAVEAGDIGAPAAVLLHGGGQTRHAWQNAVRTLARGGYHAISYDLRGHGESGWSPDGKYTPEHFSQDLLNVLGGIDKPTAVIGASMGGQAAIRALAEGRTPQVKALVLVDIVPKPARAGIHKITAFMGANLDGFASLEEVADAIAAYNPTRPRPSDLSGLSKNVRQRENGRFYWHWDPGILELGATDERIDAMERSAMDAMTRVRVPCLLVRGGESDVVDAEAMAEFRRRLVGLEISEVAGAGHMVAGDRNDAFNASVIAFLERHLPARGAP